MGDILCIGSFYYGCGDVVHEIINGFRAIDEVEVFHYDPKLYFNYMDSKGIVHKDINEVQSSVIDFFLSLPHPKAVILIAGGITVSKYDYDRLRVKGILVISIQLSDPDDFERRGSRIMKTSDIVTTNSPESLDAYSPHCETRFMLWGRSEAYDGLLPTVEFKDKAHDLIVVGGCRPERYTLVRDLVKAGVKVKLVGNGWKEVFANRHFRNSRISDKNLIIEGHQVGINKLKSIRTARYYLSFSATNMNFSNLKYGVFESFSARTPVISDSFSNEFKTQLKSEEFNFLNLYIRKPEQQFYSFILEKLHAVKEIPQTNRTKIEPDWSLSWKARLVKTLPEIFR